MRDSMPSLNDIVVSAGVMSVSGRNGGSGLAVVNEPVSWPPRTYGAVALV